VYIVNSGCAEVLMSTVMATGRKYQNYLAVSVLRAI